MKKGQVTIKDIAKALNLSPSTVSRALKNHPEISDDTKKLVQKLAEEMEYQPNPIALSLKQRKTNTIGVVIPNIVHHFFSTIISGIEDITHQKGYNVIIAHSRESFQREVESIRTLINSRVDALFVSVSKETNQYEHLNSILKRNIPLIFFDRISPNIESHRVLIDDFKGAYKAVHHLIEIGCRKIVHLAGPEILLISQERKRGYLEALQDHQIAANADYIIQSDNREKGYQVTQSLIQNGQVPDGIFAVNDETAIGAMKAIKDAGLDIPGDVAVIGFENAPISQIVEPKLSTVEQPGFAMGQAAAEIFMQHSKDSKNPLPPQSRIFDPELIIRDSTAKRKAKA